MCEKYCGNEWFNDKVGCPDCGWFFSAESICDKCYEMKKNGGKSSSEPILKDYDYLSKYMDNKYSSGSFNYVPPYWSTPGYQRGLRNLYSDMNKDANYYYG